MYQHRHQSQGRFGGDEGGVHLGGPGEVLVIFTQSISQRAENQSSTTNKLPVEVNHPKKPLEGWAVGRWWKSSDGGKMLMESSRSRAGDQMFKILNLRSSKNTLLQVDGEAVEAAEVKDVAAVKLMISSGAGENHILSR